MRKDKECPLKFTRDENGVLLIEEKEVMSRRKRYLETLLSGEADVIIAEEGAQREQNIIDRQKMLAAIINLKLSKAAGHDGITTEMIKYTGESGEDLLHLVFQLAWTISEIPVIVPIHKKEITDSVTTIGGFHC